MYIYWWRNKATYLASLKFLSGMDLELLCDRYPMERWKVLHMRNQSCCVEVALLCNTLARLCKSASPEEIEAVYRSVLNYLTGVPDLVLKTTPVDVAAGSDEKTQYCFSVLKECINYRLGTVAEEFPFVLPLDVLRNAIIGPKDATFEEMAKNCIDSQGLIPGGYLGVPYEVLSRMHGDAFMFHGLFRLVDKFVWWPDDFAEQRSCVMRGAKSLEIFVDGENTGASQVDFFLGLTLEISDKCHVAVQVFDDIEFTSRWSLAKKRSRFPFEVHGVKRAVDGKSVVDFALRDKLSEAYYTRGIRDFIIVASDSDYSGVLDSFKDARFLFVCRRSKTATQWEQRIIDDGISHFWMDESLAFRNEKVYETELIMEQANNAKGLRLDDDRAWLHFCESIGRSPDATAVKTARTRLRKCYNG